MELLVDVQHGEVGVCRVAELDVLVVPAELLVGLYAGEELGTGPEVGNSGNCGD